MNRRNFIALLSALPFVVGKAIASETTKPTSHGFTTGKLHYLTPYELNPPKMYKIDSRISMYRYEALGETVEEFQQRVVECDTRDVYILDSHVTPATKKWAIRSGQTIEQCLQKLYDATMAPRNPWGMTTLTIQRQGSTYQRYIALRKTIPNYVLKSL